MSDTSEPTIEDLKCDLDLAEMSITTMHARITTLEQDLQFEITKNTTLLIRLRQIIDDAKFNHAGRTVRIATAAVAEIEALTQNTSRTQQLTTTLEKVGSWLTTGCVLGGNTVDTIRKEVLDVLVTPNVQFPKI